ncbi:MAG TPA: EamA family transporter [Planctomycetes bacterium]|nr:EamA family transporter [Planctomycetota bacterium]
MSPDRRSWLVGCAIAAVAAILFATKGVLIKLALNAGADATALLGVRMGLSLPCFAVAAWWYGRGRTGLSRREAGQVIVLGLVGFHLASWLDVQGLRFIGVALERVVLYIYPPVVVLLGWMLGRGRPGAVLTAACLVTWLGVAVSCLDQPVQGDHLALGVALVAGSALAYAVHLVGIEPLMRAHGGARVAALGFCAAGVGVLIHAAVAVPTGIWAVQPRELWTLGALLAIVGTVIPGLLAGAAISRLGAGPSAVIGTLGPGVTVLLAWAVLGEQPSAAAWIGFALTVVGGALISVWPARR